MAGSWSAVTPRGYGYKNGSFQSMFALSAVFTADASAATVPDLSLAHFETAFLTDIGVVFDGTTPPDTVTVTVKDADGLQAFQEASITASGRVVVSDRPSLAGGCSVAISGNTTNSAKARVTLYFASNPR